jgi:hypothetical protein
MKIRRNPSQGRSIDVEFDGTESYDYDDDDSNGKSGKDANCCSYVALFIFFICGIYGIFNLLNDVPAPVKIPLVRSPIINSPLNAGPVDSRAQYGASPQEMTVQIKTSKPRPIIEMDKDIIDNKVPGPIKALERPALRAQKLPPLPAAVTDSPLFSTVSDSSDKIDLDELYNILLHQIDEIRKMKQQGTVMEEDDTAKQKIKEMQVTCRQYLKLKYGDHIILSLSYSSLHQCQIMPQRDRSASYLFSLLRLTLCPTLYFI